MKAFTLIETMLAVTILMLVATGVIFSLGNSIRSTTGSDAMIQAQLLAEEGIELVRAIKDSNTLQKKAYNLNISRTSGGTSMCATGCSIAEGVTDNTPVLTACSGTCPAVVPLSGGTWYAATENGTTVTRAYTRKITVTELSTTEMKVVSSVSYTGAKVPFESVAILTKWYVQQP
jgi:type II secretory pathway pseudopilin PulG